MSAIVDAAEAVVAALNSAGSPIEGLATAERRYRPAFELAELASLRVTVVPRSVELTSAGRALQQRDLQVDIGIQEKLGSIEGPEVDQLLEMVEVLADFCRSTGRFGDAVWVRSENDPIYSPEHLSEQRCFTSVLTLTLRTMTE